MKKVLFVIFLCFIICVGCFNENDSSIEDDAIYENDENDKFDETYNHIVLEDKTIEQLEGVTIIKDGSWTKIEGEYSDIPVNSPEEAINSLYNVKSIIGMTDPKEELELYEYFQHDDGIYEYRFTQVYKGIELYRLSPGNVCVFVNGSVPCSITARYFPIKDIEAKPAISEKEAYQYALKAVLDDYNLPKSDYKLNKKNSSSLCIYNYENIGETPVLAYKYEFNFKSFVDNMQSYNGAEVLVNAVTGEITLYERIILYIF